MDTYSRYDQVVKNLIRIDYISRNNILRLRVYVFSLCLYNLLIFCKIHFMSKLRFNQFA